MMGMLIVLAAVFFVGSFVQLVYLNYQMANPPTLHPAQLLDDAVCRNFASPDRMISASQCARLQQERALIVLESNVVDRRYHQANAIVMFSVWSRYLGFVTGMTLAMVGAAFILGKLIEPATHVEAEAAQWKASISSASPGLVLCFLGAILIVASITTLHELQTRDKAVYLGASAKERVADDGRGVEQQTPAASSPVKTN